VSSAARLRRAYFDCRYGQLHVHQAIPPGGGFDEATPLLCIPGRQGTGRFFHPLLEALGADRSIYAPDLPGCGESDSAGAGAGAEQYALAFFDLLDSLRQRRIDVLAHAEGAETAIAMERLRPQALVRRVVLSAASPKTVESVRALKIPFRELPQLGSPADAAPAAPQSSQIAELIEFFGSATPA
jgi:pimeloyl-ACP methyl ester carboxylesterase